MRFTDSVRCVATLLILLLTILLPMAVIGADDTAPRRGGSGTRTVNRKSSGGNESERPSESGGSTKSGTTKEGTTKAACCTFATCGANSGGSCNCGDACPGKKSSSDDAGSHSETKTGAVCTCGAACVAREGMDLGHVFEIGDTTTGGDAKTQEKPKSELDKKKEELEKLKKALQEVEAQILESGAPDGLDEDLRAVLLKKIKKVKGEIKALEEGKTDGAKQADSKTDSKVKKANNSEEIEKKKAYIKELNKTFSEVETMILENGDPDGLHQQFLEDLKKQIHKANGELKTLEEGAKDGAKSEKSAKTETKKTDSAQEEIDKKKAYLDQLNKAFSEVETMVLESGDPDGTHQQFLEDLKKQINKANGELKTLQDAQNAGAKPVAGTQKK